MDQDFIKKQSDQTINDVLNRYPGGVEPTERYDFCWSYNGSLTAGVADKPLFGGKFSVVAAFDYYSCWVQLRERPTSPN